MKAQFYFNGNLTDPKELARAFLQTKNEDDWIPKEDWKAWLWQQRETGNLTLEFGETQAEDAWKRHLDTIRSKERSRLEQQFKQNYPGKKNRAKRKQIRESEEYLAACAEKVREAVEAESRKRDQLMDGLVETAKQQQWGRCQKSGWKQVWEHNQAVLGKAQEEVKVLLQEYRDVILEQLQEAVGKWLRTGELWMLRTEDPFGEEEYLLPGDSWMDFGFGCDYEEVSVSPENLEVFLLLLRTPLHAQGIFQEACSGANLGVGGRLVYGIWKTIQYGFFGGVTDTMRGSCRILLRGVGGSGSGRVLAPVLPERESPVSGNPEDCSGTGAEAETAESRPPNGHAGTVPGPVPGGKGHASEVCPAYRADQFREDLCGHGSTPQGRGRDLPCATAAVGI